MSMTVGLTEAGFSARPLAPGSFLGESQCLAPLQEQFPHTYPWTDFTEEGWQIWLLPLNSSPRPTVYRVLRHSTTAMRTASPSTLERIRLTNFTYPLSHDSALSRNVCISTLGNVAFRWGAPPQCQGWCYCYHLLFLYFLAFSWVGFANPPLLKSPVNSLCWIFPIQFVFCFLLDTGWYSPSEGLSVYHRKKSSFTPGISVPCTHLPNNTLASIGCPQQMVITGLHPLNASLLETPTSLTSSFPTSLPS